MPSMMDGTQDNVVTNEGQISAWFGQEKRKKKIIAVV
jgi:hypothetical protein